MPMSFGCDDLASEQTIVSNATLACNNRPKGEWHRDIADVQKVSAFRLISDSLLQEEVLKSGEPDD